jgi:hypothetical protein
MRTIARAYPIAYATERRRAELRAMAYSDYLRSPEWAQVRWHAMHEGQHRCRLCGALDRLEVHHNDYTCRGAETPADVVVLCDACHERHHVTRPPAVDAEAVRRPAVAGPALELERLRAAILSARAVGDDPLADRLTGERDTLWRSLARGT